MSMASPASILTSIEFRDENEVGVEEGDQREKEDVRRARSATSEGPVAKKLGVVVV
jgi:hypothetical protein